MFYNRIPHFATILIILMLLSVSACGSKSETSPPPPPVEPPSLKILHQPFTNTLRPNNFYQGTVYGDGRIVILGRVNATDRTSFIVTSPDNSQFNLMASRSARESVWLPETQQSVYVDEGKLVTKQLDGSNIQLSGTETAAYFWLSPDNSKIIYTVSRNDSTGNYDIYVVDITGTNRFKVDGGEPGAIAFNYRFNVDAIHDFRPQFLPDMSKLIFLMTATSSGKRELHSVNADGSGHQIVSGTLAAGEMVGTVLTNPNIFAFTFSPDSTRIVYSVSDTAGAVSLYSVLSDATAAPTLISGAMITNGTLYTGNNRFTAKVTLDNTYVVFVANAEDVNLQELYQVPLAGGTRIKLSGTTGINVGLAPLLLSDSSRVVFSADEIYSTPITGGTPTLVSIGSDHIIERAPTLNIDESSVVYISNVAGVTDIYWSKLDGSATSNLTNNLTDPAIFPEYILDSSQDQLVYVTGTTTLYEQAFDLVDFQGVKNRISPERTYVGSARGRMYGFGNGKFYYSYQKNIGPSELFYYDLTNSTITAVSEQWPEFISEDASNLQQSNDGSVQTFMVSNTDQFNISTFVITKPNSSCRIGVNDTSNLLYSGANFFLDSNGQSVIYSTNDNPDWQLHRASVADCSTLNITPTQANNQHRVQLSPNGATIAYAESVLVAIDIDGSNSRQLSSLTSAGEVFTGNEGGFGFTPDSSRILYFADQDTRGLIEFYWANVDGSADKGKINLPLTANQEVYTDAYEGFTPKVTSDSKWVVFRAMYDSNGFELYKARLGTATDKPGNYAKLSGTLEAGSEVYADSAVTTTQISPDDNYAIFVMRSAGSQTALYSTLMDASQQPTRLSDINSTRVPERDYQSITITSDSRYVVFMGADTNNVEELWSANIDGSNRRKMNGNLVTEGQVTAFSVSADSRKVVYYANENDSNQVALFVNDIVGGNQKFLADATDYQNTGDKYDYDSPLLTNNKVIFRANIDGDGLYSMSLNGGTATKIIDIPAGRNIQKLYISALQGLIIIGDLREPGVNEVFAIKI